jgi:hypothetical protein
MAHTLGAPHCHTSIAAVHGLQKPPPPTGKCDSNQMMQPLPATFAALVLRKATGNVEALSYYVLACSAFQITKGSEGHLAGT